MLLRGEKISLRPFVKDDLAVFQQWSNDLEFLSEFNFFGLGKSNGREQHFLEQGLLSAAYGNLVVETYAGEIAGDVSYHQARYGPNEGSIAYNIGIALASGHRGKGYGSEAQRLLTEYLFAVYAIMRVEASTDVTNIPEQRALEKAGFTREGVARKAQWRNGDWHDLAIYSKLRGE
jgi:RimJ/RimL family protein N-acetyltransferase